MPDHVDGIQLEHHKLPGPWGAVEGTLQGWPDEALTIALLATAGALAWIAVKSPATIKAAAGAWVWLP